VKEQAGNTLVIIYQHVGERLRSDLSKKDIHPAKCVILLFSLLLHYYFHKAVVLCTTFNVTNAVHDIHKLLA